MQYVVLDVECYINYFLLKVKKIGSNKSHYWKSHNNKITTNIGTTAFDFLTMLKQDRLTFVTFNGINYDQVMLSALSYYLRAGYGAKKQLESTLKQLSDKIIVEGAKYWDIYRAGPFPKLEFNHIDIIEVLPKKTSLKLAAGRIGAPKMQDLPLDPSSTVSEQDEQLLFEYCDNDLDNTALLFNAIEPRLDLRRRLGEEYGIDVMSKSDAQIAEAIIKHKLAKDKIRPLKRKDKVEPFKYQMPCDKRLRFNDPILLGIQDAVAQSEFKVSAGKVGIPKELGHAIEYDGAKYKISIGGIHSQEKRQTIIPNDDQLLVELDVAAMYPSIIIEQEVYPKHIGPAFLNHYSQIRDDRFYAKKGKRDPKISDRIREMLETQDEGFKIVLNGAYGKLSSIYSFLYYPEGLIQTTITGQLSMLMLIEMVTEVGGRVVSANTDGIFVLVDKALYNDVMGAAGLWELMTTYSLEPVHYTAMHSRSVNNYFAFTSDGKTKAKGEYAPLDLNTNPNNQVRVDAAINHLKHGQCIEQFIDECNDPTQFVKVITVKDGAKYNGDHIGKVVRFYHSLNPLDECIRRVNNDHKVPTSDDCRPLMNLMDFDINDVDKEWYVQQAYATLKHVGAV